MKVTEIQAGLCNWSQNGAKTVLRIFAVGLITAVAWGQAISFNVAPAFPAGAMPTSVASGDFNGDGKPDVAVTNKTGVSVLLNNGNGGFQPQVNYAIGAAPPFVAVGDFNGDGKKDLAVANPASASVSILLGSGNGTFQSPSNFAAGISPHWILTGDFNGDGKLDLTVIDYRSSGVSILMGNGNGTFQAARGIAAGQNFRPGAVGDFNGDGKLDLAIANVQTDNLSVLLGNGDGTFQPAVDYSLDQPASGASPTSVTTADFNLDGKLDLAVALPNRKAVAVLFGLGNGAFQASVRYGLDDPNFSNGENALATADLNGDGKPDLVLVNLSADHLTILLNAGNGTFPTSRSYAAGPEPTWVAVDDFNGDGRPDLAVAANAPGLDTGVVALLLGNGDGSLQAAPLYRSALNSGGLAVADLNGDGKADIVAASRSLTTSAGPGSGVTMLGDGNGAFQAPIIWDIAGATSLALGDFNGDGTLDVVETTTGNGSVVAVRLGNGDGTFQAPVTYNAGAKPTALAVGDFNGDGKPDLVVGNQNSANVSILLNAGNGTFQPAVNYSTPNSGTPDSVVVADFNGDGKLDVGVALSGGSVVVVVVLLGNGNGTFQSAVSFPLGFNSPREIRIASADFNSDGRSDLAVTDGPRLAVLISSGTSFAAPLIFSLAGPNGVGGYPTGYEGMVVATDINGDGKPDLAATSTIGITVLLSNGDGTFQPPTIFDPFLGGAVAVGDFNGDGKLDLVAADSQSDQTSTDTVAILLNTSGIPLLTIASSPSGLMAVIDGGPTCTTPCNIPLSGASEHTISVVSPQASSPGTRFLFDSWSDGGAISHLVRIPAGVSVTYTATFKRQYQLTTAAAPATGGTVSPATGGYYDAGQTVSLTATPSAGYTFSNWTGSVAGSTNASTTVTMSAPQSVTANFALISGGSIQTRPGSLQFLIGSGDTGLRTQTVSVTSVPAGLAVSRVLTPAGSWLSATLSPAATPATLSVSVDPTGLTPGTLSGNIALSAGSATVNLPVTVTVIVSLTISPTTNSFSAAGGTGSTTVTLNPANSTASWRAVSNAPWITITSPLNGNGSGSGVTVGYAVAANPGAARTGTFSMLNSSGLEAATFTVSQSAAGCSSLSASPTSFTFGLAGGSGAVNFSIPGCPVASAVSSAPWLIPAAATLSSLPFTVQANTGATRSATLTINGGLTVNVTQTGLFCAYSIQTHPGSSPAYGPAGGTGGIDVITPPGCPVPPATTSSPFLTITGTTPSPGPGAPATVNYSVAASATARAGSITIAGLVYVITQSAAGQGYTCAVNAESTPTLRREGASELAGVLDINCNGQSPAGTTGDFLVTLNTSITNRLISTDPSLQTTDGIMLKNAVTGQPLVIGVNAFRGTIAGPNAIRFHGVSLDSGSFSLRIVNLRVDASSAGNSVTATVAAAAPVPIAVSGSPTVALVSAAGINRLPIVTGALSGTSFQGIVFTETQPDSFRTQQQEGGYQNSALGSETGAATNATRLLATFSGVPPNVNLYAPLGPVSDNGAQLISADSNGAGGFPLFGSATIRGTQAGGYQPVRVINGAGTATWQVTDADPATIETFTFNLLIDNPGNVDLSNMTVTMALGPLVPIREPSTASMPRFVRSGAPQGSCLPGSTPRGVPCLRVASGLTALGLVPPTSGASRAAASNAAIRLAGPGRFDDLRLAIPLVVANDSSSDAASAVNLAVGTDTPNITIIGCSAADLATCIGGGSSLTVGFDSLAPGQQPIVIIYASASSATFPADGLIQFHASISSADGNRSPGAMFNVDFRAPVLNVKQTPAPLVSGQNSTVAVTVGNAAGAGDVPGGLVQIEYQLPAGVSPGTISGTNWTCNTQTPQTPLCTYQAVLRGGSTAEPLNVTVFVNPVSPPATLTFKARLLLVGGFDLTTDSIDTTSITVRTAPSGLQFSLDAGSPLAAPQTLFLAQTSHTLAVTSPQTLSGAQYAFTGWADGASTPSRSISVGTASATYTANFGTAASLSIAKSHSGSFRRGQQGALYTVTVSNSGNAATAGAATVTESLPAGLTLGSMSGTGWTCVGTVCTRNDPLAGGASYPAIAVSVNVAANAPSSLVNQVSLTGGTAAVTASDPTTISDCSFSTSLTSAGLGSGSGTTGSPLTGSFTLTATNCTAADTWIAVSDSPRLQISPSSGTGATSSTTINFSLFTNSTTLARVFHITVAGTQVAVTQAGSTENPSQRVARALYQTILGREPDAGGFAFWTGPGAPRDAASGGILFNQMADGFYTSPEFKNSGWLALNIYQVATGALPNFAAWLSAVTKIRNQSQTAAQLTDSLAGAGSNSAFINAAFQNGFGRAPSSSEFNNALNSLNAGQSKFDFLNSAILTNNEFTTRTNGMLVQALYYTILVRDVDTGGFNFWLGQLNPPAGQNGIYYLYNPQPPTPQYGFKLAVIGQAVPPNPQLLGFLGSPEFQSLIQ